MQNNQLEVLFLFDPEIYRTCLRLEVNKGKSWHRILTSKILGRRTLENKLLATRIWKNKTLWTSHCKSEYGQPSESTTQNQPAYHNNRSLVKCSATIERFQPHPCETIDYSKKLWAKSCDVSTTTIRRRVEWTVQWGHARAELCGNLWFIKAVPSIRRGNQKIIVSIFFKWGSQVML